LNQLGITRGAEHICTGKFQLVPTNVKTVLTNEEKSLKEKLAGKTE
jgi:hypothetical protein